MRHALTGTLALVAAAGLTASCGGSTGNSSGSPGDDGDIYDAAVDSWVSEAGGESGCHSTDGSSEGGSGIPDGSPASDGAADADAASDSADNDAWSDAQAAADASVDAPEGSDAGQPVDASPNCPRAGVFVESSGLPAWKYRPSVSVTPAKTGTGASMSILTTYPQSADSDLEKCWSSGTCTKDITITDCDASLQELSRTLYQNCVLTSVALSTSNSTEDFGFVCASSVPD